MHIKNIHSMIEKLSECTKVELDKGIEKIDTEEMSKVAEIIKELCEAEYYATVTKAMEEHDFDNEEDIMDEGRKGYRGQPRDSMGRYMSRRGRRGKRGYEEPMMMPEYDMEEMEYMRDMDKPYGKMYYSGGGSSGGMSGGSRGGSQGGGSMGGSMGGSQGGRMSGGGSRGYSDGGTRGYSEGRQSEGGNYSSRMQDGGRDGREGRSGQSRRSYMETKEMNTENTAEAKQMKMKELERYMTELGTDVTEMIAGASPEEKSLLKSKMSALVQKL